ncbi:MAG: 50S ribosomal protein L6 [Nanoarchaeota archaeon]|nr:50S ribosomal protein L6 [Nanoarchaeota archaeon]
MEHSLPIPEGATAAAKGTALTVTGPKGELTRTFENTQIEFALTGKEIVIRTKKDASTVRKKGDEEFVRRRTGTLMGTWQAHMKNMFLGVQQGFEARLKIIFSHFPIKIAVEGDTVVISNFLGERAPRKAKVIPGIEVKVQKDEVIITGINVEDVGNTAANIEIATKINKFDRRVFQDGCHLIQKCKPIEA